MLLFASLVALASGEKRQAVMLRHCVRSTAHDADLAAYSATPLPEWGVPKNWCTERGLQIVELVGKSLKQDHAVRPNTVRVIADNSTMRTAATASALLRGMGVDRPTVIYDDKCFHSTKPRAGPAVCEGPSNNVTITERKMRFAQVPLPWDLDEALEELHGIIGLGPAGRIRDLGGLQLNAAGKPTGSVDLLRKFGQVLLYAYASEIPFANASGDQLNKFIAWHDWYRSVADFHSLEATDSALLLRGILEGLNSSEPGADIFVGHDDNVDGLAIVLDLLWEAPPYMGGKLAPTPPNSGLFFERDLDTGALSVSYAYHAFNASAASDDFAMHRSMIRSWASIDELWAFALDRLDKFVGAKKCFMAGEPTVSPVVV